MLRLIAASIAAAVITTPNKTSHNSTVVLVKMLIISLTLLSEEWRLGHRTWKNLVSEA